jgi:hypothetical protein
VQTLNEIDELKIQNKQKIHDEKISDSSKESDVNTSTWTQESLARLVGFEEDDEIQNSSQTYTDTHQISEPAASSTKSNFGNVLTDVELFGTLPDDSTPKPQPLSSNPWSKFALVGSGLLAIFFVAGLILNQIIASKSGKSKPKSASPTPSPTPSLVADKENSEGRLKTELALQKQADKLQKVDEATRQKNKDLKDKNKKHPGQDQGKQPQPTKVRTSYAPTPEPPSYQTAPPERTWSPSPMRIPQPSVATSPPPASSPVLSKNPLHQIAEKPLKSADSPSIDPVKQWQTLARLGSYGQVQMVDVQKPQDSNTRGRGDSVSQGIEDGLRSASPYLERSSSSDSQQRTRGGKQDTRFSSTSPTSAVRNSSKATPATSTASASDEETIREEEFRVLEGVPIRIATVGTATSGVLATPVIWSGDAKETGRASSSSLANKVSSSNSDFDQRFVVTLDQPLLDSQGKEVIAAGANLIFWRC